MGGMAHHHPAHPTTPQSTREKAILTVQDIRCSIGRHKWELIDEAGFDTRWLDCTRCPAWERMVEPAPKRSSHRTSLTDDILLLFAGLFTTAIVLLTIIRIGL